MKITFTDGSKSEIVGFMVDEGGKLPSSAEELDKDSGGLLTEASGSGRFSGKTGQQAFIVLPKGNRHIPMLFQALNQSSSHCLL